MINRKLAVILVILVILLIFIALGAIFSDIFFYLASSIILATILKPLANLVYRTQIIGLRLPRFLAVLISFFALSAVIAAFVIVFIPLISDQVKVISGLNFEDIIRKLSQPISYLEDLLISNNLVDKAPGFIVDTIQDNSFTFFSNLDFQEIINSLLSLTGNIFISFMAISFITFFLLYEPGLLKSPLFSLVPNKYFEVFIAAVYKIEDLLSNYLRGLLLQMVVIFSVVSIGLSLFGVKYALTIALFSAFANLIPYLGPLLGATFGIIVGLSSSANFEFSQATVFLILKIVAVFSVVQINDNVIIQPLIFSKSVKAHPLEIFVVIFAGATVAGIGGMIAAIPVYTIIRVSVIEIRRAFNEYYIFKAKHSIWGLNTES